MRARVSSSFAKVLISPTERYTMPYAYCIRAKAIHAYTYPCLLFNLDSFHCLFFSLSCSRLIGNGLRISRPSDRIARYTMLRHARRDQSPNQFIDSLIRTSKIRFPIDGLTTAKFRLCFPQVNNGLYTHFLIDVGQPAYLLSPTFTQEKGNMSHES